MIARRKRLGDLLISGGLITEEQLNEALAKSKDDNRRIGEVLVELGFLTETDVFAAVGEQLGVPFVSLTYYSVDTTVIQLIPEQIARQHTIIPLFKVRNSLTLGMADPLNLAIIDQVVRATGLEVEPAICSGKEIVIAIDHYYGTSSSVDEVIEVMAGDEEETEDENALTSMAEEAPIVKLVNLILSQAVKDGASDIHFNPEEKILRVRFRVDGVLREAYSQPKKVQNALISRVKVMASLDISERRVPQDGRIQMKIEGKPIDLRVSSLPTVYGENMVLRILDKSNLQISLSNLGFGDQEGRFRDIIGRPNGVVLVTGPTGSGKTTTLYSALNEVSTIEVNTITLENPVEYRLPLIRQTNINEKAGMTFAAGLRSILRQDPDIVMVGEIRDGETATIAVEAALTGHLVLATLHTNDAPGSLPRLVDMGVEPFLVASAVAGILAQRLVRRICTGCKVEYKPTEAEIKLTGTEDPDAVLYKGEGCRACGNTGYKGRAGIYEIMVMNEEIRDLTMAGASADKLMAAARRGGMLTLREDGMLKVLQGITTLEEVMSKTSSVA